MPEIDAAAIAERRAAVVARLEDLIAERGRAVLDGKSLPDHKAVTAAEAELVALDAAEAEATRRRRAAAEKAEAERIAALRKVAGDKCAEYLGAIARAERGCRELVAAIGDAIECAAGIRKAAAGITGRAPLSLSAQDIARRISGRLMVHLAAVAPSRGDFGDIPLRHHPHVSARDDWREAEQRGTAREIATLLGKDLT